MRILLVDDDSDDQYFIQEALASIDPSITCKSAGDGEEALSILAKSEQLPDIIFLDINMPRMDGRECLKAIRRDPRLCQANVFVISTSVSRDDEMLLGALGAPFMVKPNDYSALANNLSQCLEKFRKPESVN
jgi:CheY-like chemotaxis protein